MNWKELILFSIIAIGFFGIFWTLNIADMGVEFTFEMDNNTLEAVKALTYADILNNTEEFGYSVPVTRKDGDRYYLELNKEVYIEPNYFEIVGANADPQEIILQINGQRFALKENQSVASFNHHIYVSDIFAHEIPFLGASAYLEITTIK